MDMHSQNVPCSCPVYAQIGKELHEKLSDYPGL